MGECCICLEDKPLIKFATCIHTACLNCYKTIYLGLNRPIHWREMTENKTKGNSSCPLCRAK